MLTAGNRINTTFYGKPFQIVVSSIEGDNLEKVTVEDNFTVLFGVRNDISDENTSVASLSQSLLDFSLSDTSTVCSSPLTPSASRNEKRDTQLKSVSEAGILTTVQHTKFFLVTEQTKINIQNSAGKEESVSAVQSGSTLNHDDEIKPEIGGYKAEIKVLSDMLNRVFLKSDDARIRMGQGFQAPRGVLLYGPSGCGKSLLVKCMISSYKVNVVYVHGPDIWSK